MNDVELFDKANEERNSIVEKYKRGRQAGVKVDSWEDASFEVYHTLDRYGFIQKLPEGNTEGVPVTKVERDDDITLERERERLKKWSKMVKSWDSVSKDKLKKRIYKGVPEAVRGTVWSKLLDLDTIKQEQHGKYAEMSELAHNYSPDIRQIDLDVNRTYREHIMFRERYNAKQCQLFNILSAYSIYNIEIGYCQGMSQIAALLLMYLDEEDAFWALSTIVSNDRFNMHGFYIPGFPKLLRYQAHHDKIMLKFLPKLKRHLDRNGVDTVMYTLKWFFQCFLDRIPFKLTLRIWDIFILDGERVLTAMAFNILKFHRKHIFRLGMDDIIHFLQVKLPKDFGCSDDEAVRSLQRCIDELRRSRLDYAGSPPADELPKKPFGVYKPDPKFQQKVIGLRREEFSSTERITRDAVVMRRESTVHSPNERIGSPHSHTSGPEAVSLYEEGSSIMGASSHKSLAGTSITSTADLSIFSSATRSQAADANSYANSAVDDSEGEQEPGEEHEDEGRTSSGPATPLAVPIPRISSASPDDVVRIFVPLPHNSITCSSSKPHQSSSHNGDVLQRDNFSNNVIGNSCSNISRPSSIPQPPENRIRITIMEQSSSEDLQTPIVEQHNAASFMIESQVD